MVVRVSEMRAGALIARRIALRSGPDVSLDNVVRQRKALAQMTQCELVTGKTVEQLDAEMADQRRRVLARYGVAE